MRERAGCSGRGLGRRLSDQCLFGGEGRRERSKEATCFVRKGKVTRAVKPSPQDPDILSILYVPSTFFHVYFNHVSVSRIGANGE